MMLFYSLDGRERKGPVTKEEFAQLRVSSDTLIWYDGLSDWKRVGDVQELATLIPLSAPANLPFDGFADEASDLAGREGILHNQKARRLALLGIGGLVLVFVLFKIIRNVSDLWPDREPFVHQYAANFTTKLMSATYPFSGRDPRYEVQDWVFEEGFYHIDLTTLWSGSCHIFDTPCEVGWGIRLVVSEEGVFEKYEMIDRNDCAARQMVCETALATVENLLRNQSLE